MLRITKTKNEILYILFSLIISLPGNDPRIRAVERGLSPLAFAKDIILVPKNMNGWRHTKRSLFWYDSIFFHFLFFWKKLIKLILLPSGDEVHALYVRTLGTFLHDDTKIMPTIDRILWMFHGTICLLWHVFIIFILDATEEKENNPDTSWSHPAWFLSCLYRTLSGADMTYIQIGQLSYRNL